MAMQLAFVGELRAEVSCVADGGKLKVFLGIDPQEEAKQSCPLNSRGLGAGVDKRHRRPQRGSQQKFVSACVGTFEDMKNAAERYKKKQEEKCAEINRIVNESKTCAAKKPTEQTGCFDKAREMLKKARSIQDDLIKDLDAAKKTIADAMEANKKAIADYEKDKKAIQAAQDKAMAESQRDPELRAVLQRRIVKSPAVDTAGNLLDTPSASVAVMAENGGDSTISGYKHNAANLAGEQASAIESGKFFRESAEEQKSFHRQQQTELDKMIGQFKTVNMGKVEPSPKPGSGISGNDGASTQSPAASAAPQASAAPAASASPASGLSNAAQQAAGAAAGASGAGGGGGGGAPAPVAEDYSSYGGGSQAAKSETKTESAGYTKEKSQTENAASPREVGFVGAELPNGEVGEDSPTISSGGSTLEGAAGREANTSAKNSSAKAVGASTAGAAGGGEGRSPTSAKEATQLAPFKVDLTAGAVDIAGSDINAAMADLSTDLLGGPDLASPSQGLTLDENSRLQIAEGLSEAGAQADNSVGALESEDLFLRTRAAHNRALQKGLLIRGVRAKL